MFLKDVADSLGCYKAILDCSEANIPFYEKCGFDKKGIQMSVTHPHNDGALSKPN